MTPIVIAAAAAGVLIFVVILVWMVRYRKCPPNHMMVVYGRMGGGATHVVLKEGGRFVWPLIQDSLTISRAPLNVVDEEGQSIAVVRIGNTDDLLENAAIQLVDLERDEIARMARDILVSTGHPDDPTATQTELHRLGLVLMKS